LRNFSIVRPALWSGGTGRILRASGPEAQLVAAYLITNQHANMIGLYYLPLGYMTVDLASPPEALRKGLAGCVDAGFCRYDDPTGYIWVVNMAREQVMDEKGVVHLGDNRVRAAVKMFEASPKTPFHKAFALLYGPMFGAQWTITDGRACQGLAKGLPRGVARSPSDTDADADSDTDQNKDGKAKTCSRKRERGGYAEPFLAFWQAYPRKTAKGAAAKAWDKARPPLPDVLKALDWQCTSEQWTKDGGQFIPLPATYLNQRRWEDEPQAPAAPAEHPAMKVLRQSIERGRARDGMTGRDVTPDEIKGLLK
jgi:hypothetical protein